DGGARADEPEERAVASVSWNSGVIDPAKCAVVTAKPVLHPEFLPVVEVADVGFEATIKILLMNAFRPAASKFLRHAAAGKGQPWSIKPYTQLVLSGHPDHDRGGVHDLAEPRIQSAGRLGRHFHHGILSTGNQSLPSAARCAPHSIGFDHPNTTNTPRRSTIAPTILHLCRGAMARRELCRLGVKG